jgi:GT2 family glycosyltransferase
MRAARGEFIALLDADDVWLPNRLERGIALLETDPEIGLVHARVVRINRYGTITGQLKVDTKYMSGRIARHIYTRRAHIVCPTVMFRRSCIETAGWFDEAMQATEDRDLWFRIALHYKVAYIDEVLAYYRLSPSSMTSNLDRLLTGQLYFVAKHYRSGAATRVDQLQALGNIYRELGDSLFRGGAVSKSIGSYLRAVGYNPLSIPNVYMLFRAIMDPVVRVCVSATRLSNAGV